MKRKKESLTTCLMLVVGLAMVLNLGCSDQKILEPDCEGCFRYHVDMPNSGTPALLRDIHFVTGAVGWAVGEDGLILRSSDGGATWATNRRVPGAKFWGVHFLSANLGWAVTDLGILARTSNGGANWEDRRIGSYATTSVFLIDDSRGFVVGRDVILRTKNSGALWQVYEDIPPLILSIQYAVTFVDPNNGWVVASDQPRILHTNDGGNHWNPQINPSTHPLKDVAFANGSVGLAVGVGGNVIRTIDGGLTWTKQAIGTALPLHGVDMWDVNRGVVVGDDGIVFTTLDGGVHWEQRVSGTTNDLLSVSYVSANSFCTCGENGTILRFTYEWDDCCE